MTQLLLQLPPRSSTLGSRAADRKRDRAPEIFGAPRAFIALPRSVTSAMLAAMPRTILLGWIACCGAADGAGVFSMSRLAMVV